MLNASLGVVGGIKHVSGLGGAASNATMASASAAAATASWDKVALTICFVTLNIITIVSVKYTACGQKIENE